MSGMKSRRGVAALAAVVCCLYWPIVGADPGDALRGNSPGVNPPSPARWEHGNGNLRVSEQTGTFQYSYPIAVPSGRLGVEPTLALSYSSSGPRRGGIAAGWTLDIPEIARDLSDGRFVTEVWVSSLASGQRLLPSSDPVPSGSQAFRAQHDASQARYVRTGSRWEARLPSGMVYRFNEPGSLNTNAPVDRALLTSITDPFGNMVTYHWERLGVVGVSVQHWKLTTIRYTYNNAAGLVHHAEVSFNYQAAPACGTGNLPVGTAFEYRGGVPEVTGASQLGSIVTRVRDLPSAAFRTVRTISLGYDASAASCNNLHGPVRLLSSIRESAVSKTGVTTTLPATTFQYGPLWQNRTRALTGFQLPTNSAGLAGLSWGSHGFGFSSPPEAEDMLLDLDGDGLVDRLRSIPGPFCRAQWLRNDGDSFDVAGTIDLPMIPWARGASTPSRNEHCSLTLQYSLVITPSLRPSGADCTHIPTHNVYRFLDLDGDARPELLTAIYHGIYSYNPSNPGDPAGDDEHHPGPAECENERIPHQVPPFPEAPTGYSVKVYQNLGDGTFSTTPTTRTFPFPLDVAAGDAFAGRVKPVVSDSWDAQGYYDLDGDGKLDAVESSTTGSWKLRRGVGTGQFGAPVLWPAPAGSYLARSSSAPNASGRQIRASHALQDVNGDGLPDLLVGNTTSPQNITVYLNYGAGFDATGRVLTNLTASPSHTTIRALAGTPNQFQDADRYHVVRIVDVDGDGLVDIAHSPGWASPTTSRVYAGTALRFVGQGARLPYATDYAAIFSYALDRGSWIVQGDIIDLDGDGLAEHVVESSVWSRAVPQAPPALMHQIDNGLGGVTRVTYASNHDPSVVAQADGRVPHGGWVVRELTSDATPSAPQSISSYRYEKPVYNKDIYGRWGFRGFTKVVATAPLGSTTEQVFDYALRWDGLLTGTTVKRAGGQLHTRTTTSYTPFTFGWIQTLLTSETRAQTFFDGTGAGRGNESPTVVSRINYALQSGMYLSDWSETEVIAPNPLVPVPAKQRTTNTYEVTLDASTLHVRPDVTERFEWKDGAWQLVGRTDETWIGPQNVATDVYYSDHTHGFSRTARTFRRSGQLATIRRPVQVEAEMEGRPSAVRRYLYDDFDVTGRREIDELGFFHDSDTDLGTGVAYRAYQVHAIPDGATQPRRWTETVLDGFGRPLRAYRTRNDSTDETVYAQELISQSL